MIDLAVAELWRMRSCIGTLAECFFWGVTDIRPRVAFDDIQHKSKTISPLHKCASPAPAAPPDKVDATSARPRGGPLGKVDAVHAAGRSALFWPLEFGINP